MMNETLHEKRSRIATESNLKSWKNPLIRKKRIKGIIYTKLGNRTESKVYKQIKELLDGKLSANDIAKTLNLSSPTIYHILRNKKDKKSLELLRKGGSEKRKTHLKNGQSSILKKLRDMVKKENDESNINKQKNTKL